MRCLMTVALTVLFSFQGLAQDDSGTEMNEDAEESTEAEETAPTSQASTNTNSSEGTSYRCTLDNLVRNVAVKYETAGEKVPCQVVYDKEVEAPGQSQVLWRADNLEGFCEEKTATFVDKLRSNGWECSAS